MEKIEWSDRFSVGVGTLDEQHQTLIGMMNQLIDTPNVDSNSTIITDLLNGMIEYATTHFVEEERLMGVHNYPDFLPHQEQHVAFMKKTAEFCSVEEGTVVVHDFSETVLAYLRAWWIQHIQVDDMKYKSLFIGKNLS
jgi:hemerythrin-like metal-binding protein